MRTCIVVPLLGLFCLSLGCALFRADEAPDAGYLVHPERMKEDRDRFPFDKVWLKDYSENYYQRYSSVVVAPVNTTHLLKMDWTEKLSLEGEKKVAQDAAEIAKYMRNAFVEAIRKDEHSRLTVLNKAADDSLVLEVALVELVPTKAWLNVSGNIVGYFIPGFALATGIAAEGSVAIEGRFRDAKSGEIVAMFKDRQSDQLSPIGIQDFTWYNHSKDEIDDWAEQIDEILNTPADHKVAETRPITLRIW